MPVKCRVKCACQECQMQCSVWPRFNYSRLWLRQTTLLLSCDLQNAKMPAKFMKTEKNISPSFQVCLNKSVLHIYGCKSKVTQFRCLIIRRCSKWKFWAWCEFSAWSVKSYSSVGLFWLLGGFQERVEEDAKPKIECASTFAEPSVALAAHTRLCIVHTVLSIVHFS